MAHRRFVRSRSRSMKTWLAQIEPARGIDIMPIDITSGFFSAGNKFFGSPFVDDVTILRTRGSAVFNMEANAGMTHEDAVSVAVGVGLVTEEAAIAGAMPLPFDNPGWDGWFYYQTVGFEHFNTGLVGTEVGIRASWEIDSKAMRKIQGGMVLALATQIAIGATASATSLVEVNSVISIRALLKTS